MLQPNLMIGDIITNNELTKVFAVNPQQGMRRSLLNNCLVLVSDYTKGLYDDKWERTILHYTGMGDGNQSFTYKQNKTVLESKTNGVSLFLFEVLQPKNYIYRGEVELADTPYMSRQIQKGMGEREVCIFPLRLKLSESAAGIDLDILNEREEQLTEKANKEKFSNVKEKAKLASGKPGNRIAYSTVYERNIYVKNYVLRLAKGVCQLCNVQAPFNDKKGNPYLEVHHIDWLSKGGHDIIENAVALCPNCHRKMHINVEASDVMILKNKAILQGKL